MEMVTGDDSPKDSAAQEMAKKRWARTTAKQRSQIAKDLNAVRWAGHVPAAKAKKAKAKKK